MSISYQVIQQYFTAIEKGAGPQKQKIIQTLIMVNQHVPDLRKDQFKVLKGKNQRVQVRIDFGDKQTIFIDLIIKLKICRAYAKNMN